MRTSFHHQPEAQHPNFQLLTSWQADYPIFWGGADMNDHMARTAPRAFDPKRTWIGLKSRSAAVSCPYRAPPTRFRIIQVGPKDFLAPLRQVEAAVD
jgi:hypothetical protein